MKNDFLTLIKTRRSIRAYKPDAVPADTLARVLEAGTYAPSAMGEQSATIVAVETKAYREREIFDSPDGKALLRDWGLPETLRGVGAIALGYAAGPAPEAAPRKENYIVHV